MSSEPEEALVSPASRASESVIVKLRVLLSSPRKAKIGVYATRIVLLGVLLAFVWRFTQANLGMLFDADLQNDDARTILFPFHQYGEAGTLGDDPIAQEMLSAVPWGVRGLYLVLVPFIDIFAAAKVVQFISLGVLGWAAFILSRSRRTGLAAGVLLVFLMLHTPFVVDRVAGGLPRAFGFPCFALWVAGLMAGKRLPRFLAPVLLALSYPSIMNLILAAEGLLAIRGAGRRGGRVVLRRLKRYALVVGVCFVCVLPAAMGSSDRGPIHTLEQAKKEPAFGRSGRLYILPFAEPVKAMGEAFLDPVSVARPARSDSALRTALRNEGVLIAAALMGLLLLIPILRWGPSPQMAIAFVAGAIIVYAASRILAFRLYSPERYYSFGMRMAGIAVIMCCVPQAWFWVKNRSHRESARNLTVLAFVGLVWGLGGDRIRTDTGMVVDRKTDAELYEFVRTLPKDVRFATHILDGDGIPLFGARAHMGSYETLQPWFVDSWARQKERAMSTQAAYYATERKTVLDYVEKHGVTHFLLNKGRLGKHASRKSGSFQPFTAHVRKILKKRRKRPLLFTRPPKGSVVFQQGRFRVVSVEELKKIWEKTPEKKSSRKPKKGTRRRSKAKKPSLDKGPKSAARSKTSAAPTPRPPSTESKK